MYIELTKGIHKWFWRLVSSKNGQTVLVSQRYSTKWSAKRSAKKVADANDYKLKVV